MFKDKLGVSDGISFSKTSNSGIMLPHSSIETHSGIGMVGNVRLENRGPDGVIKDVREGENLVVAAGVTYILSRMKDASATAMSHMGLGSSTTAASSSQTDLGSILGAREALDSTTANAANIVYVCGFEAGDATGAVTEAGIFNASTGGTMLCRIVFSVVNKGAADTMTVTWTISLTAS